MDLKFDEKGLIGVIAQDYLTKDVLMFAYMNQLALDKTLETGKVHYFSRSRNCLWLKGETSGHVQLLKQMFYDCDQDCLLVTIEQIGGACHTGHRSCFYRNIDGADTESKLVFDPKQAYAPKDTEDALTCLYDTVAQRKATPLEGSYTNYLLDKGLDKTLKKVGEESAEVIIAAKNVDTSELVMETADLMYHLSVMMVQRGINWDDVYNELKKRRH